jgi:hypothetical protein
MLAAAATFDGQHWVPSTILGLGFDGLMSVFIRPGGNGLALWSAGQDVGRSDPEVRYVSAFDARRGWDRARPLADAQISEATSPVGEGQTVLSLPSNTSVDVSRFRSDGSWTAAEGLDLGKEARPALASAVDEAGNAIVVWLRSQCCVDGGLVDTVWTARFDVRRGWDAPRALDPIGRARHSLPLVEVDRTGNGYAAWAAGPDAIEVARFTTASGWSPPVRANLGTPPIPGITLEGISVDGRGGAHLFWRMSDAPTPSRSFPQGVIWTARFTNGRQTTPPERLAEADDVAAATNADGAAVAGWSKYNLERDGPGTVSTYIRRYGRAGWREPELVPPAGDRPVRLSTEPHVVVDDHGRALVMWLESDAVMNDVWVRRFRL